MDITVVGSMNMDLVVQTNNLPQKGETIKGKSFKQIPGGKGANQAMAAAKLEGDVTLISACGKDLYGDTLIHNLTSGGVNTENILRVDDSTGIAAITIEKDGDNRIIIVPGANNWLTPEVIDGFADKIIQANIILLQMEIPLETIIYTIGLAAKHQTKVILDPAPPQALPEDIYTKIDYLLPNEIELDLLLNGNKFDSLPEKASYLLDKGLKHLIVTQGEKGVTHFSKGFMKTYEAYKVKVIDTTAAGDAFAGALGYGFSRGWDEGKAIQFASKVAALSVSKFGAQTSLPDLNEVLKYKGHLRANT